MLSCCTNYFSRAAPLLSLLLLTGCAAQEAETRFVTTIAPIRAVMQPVVGERVAVLVPAGASPHTYEPRPSDARHAARAVLLVYGSPELDGWAASLDAADRLGIVDLLPDSVRRSAHGGVDPHFWMDPLAVRVLAPVLADTLCRYDVEHCQSFRRNAAAFTRELDLVHDSLMALMAPVGGSSVLMSHPFLEYFGHRYGLRIAGSIEELPGSEPTPRDLQRLLRAARASSPRAIFTQPQHSSRAAEAVGEALGIPVVELDPVGAAEDLSDLLYLTAQTIRDALLDPPAPP